ncbi:MAG: hypothetical protein AAGB26_05875 [Planctomycetota bacterium]
MPNYRSIGLVLRPSITVAHTRGFLGGPRFGYRLLDPTEEPQLRYTRYDNRIEKLYNADNDPNEWNNLASDPKRAAVTAEL